MKGYKYFLATMASVVVFAIVAPAQSAGNKVKTLIDSQHYVFEAQFANPMSGRMRTLTSLYTVTIAKDTVIADLPYFGKATIAPVDPNQAGIQFTSTNFTYTANRTKRAWNITVKPKDVSDGNQLFFTIFDNGSATLQVTSNSRDGISFNGFVRAGK